MKNIPKIIHLYWDGSSMSYLHYLTVLSLNKLNPDWEIIVHTPKVKFNGITWETGEQSVPYTGKDFWPKVKSLDFVKINVFDFNTIGIVNEIPEVFKSDFIRWYLLSTVGGVWSDFDILYVKPLNEVKFEGTMVTGEVDSLSTALVFDGFHHIIGFYMSEPNNPFFSRILEESKRSLNFKGYQSIGSRLLMRMYPTLDVIRNQFGDKSISNLPMEVVYPIIASEKTIYDLFFNDNIKDYITDNTIGIHWYNGDKISKDYLNNFEENSKNGSIISNLIEKYDINSYSLL